MTGRAPGWTAAPADLRLREGELHVWRVSLSVAEAKIGLFRAMLSADEQDRARRFFFERDRSAFVVTRGVLRILLGRYLGWPPDGLRFRHGPEGKPALTERSGGNLLDFNVSHSHGMALLAMARGRAVGVDVEKIRPGVATEDIAARFFAPREVAMLCAVPVPLRVGAFFTCWTRKEAYIKATGKGLSLPLDGFVVSVAPGEPAAILETRPDAAEASRWHLTALALGVGYVGAVAVAGARPEIKCWDWTETAFGYDGEVSEGAVPRLRREVLLPGPGSPGSSAPRRSIAPCGV